MSHEFLLLRHGKSAWPEHCPDINRPLKKRGRRDAERIGAWLWQHECIPTSIIASTATRAEQTAYWCAKAMGLSPERITLDERLYLATPATLLEVLAERLVDTPSPVPQRPLLVGHNPGLEQLIEQLCDTPPPYPEDQKLIPTASLAWFKLLPHQTLPELRQTELKHLVRARELPREFPFRSRHGLEWRPKPAYWYSQVAVIPLRRQPLGSEILLIRSRGDKKWTFCQGPAGQFADDSATALAWQQAGVESDHQPTPVSELEIDKWGAHCHIQVFNLEVSTEHQQWPQDQRQRRWVALHQASEWVDDDYWIPVLQYLQHQELQRRRR